MNNSRLQLVPIIAFLILACFQSCEPDKGDDIIECAGCNEEEPDDNGEGNPTARKPNIYIYPTTKIELLVSLNFPQEGMVIESIPDYGDGWKVSVDTNGIIDDSYNFLFYESIQPDVWQRKSGWQVNREDLENFFRENMKEYGFRGQEIRDFIEYWIPRLNDSYYLIYPQAADIINSVIEVNFSILPDNFLRLFYVVEGYNTMPQKNFSEPLVYVDFAREGYFDTSYFNPSNFITKTTNKKDL